jgi:hypothetical protein
MSRLFEQIAQPDAARARYQQAHADEFLARPPGRLGRRLLEDVDRYLGFFAIARGYATQ